MSSSRLYSLLTPSDREFHDRLEKEYRLTHSDSRQLQIILRDIQMWGEPSPAENWQPPSESLQGKDRKKAVLSAINRYWEDLKASGQDYSSTPPVKSKPVQSRFEEITDNRNILGSCPVASEKTRCCNLMTLDAVFRCGYDCSYCSIQSFYNDGRISFHGNLKEKLQALELDPERLYHIGTGQSSDSLMWGNREGLLENLMDFARNHPNVILELKTKSDNISWLQENAVPFNVQVTWSLNTPYIIAREERLTADLDRRLKAARTLADKGAAIGFHFHPMVRYRSWREDYTALFQRVRREFRPEELVLISLGTLTYIKPVLKKIRQRDFRSAILRMPMEEAAGKFSYPLEEKKELFQLALDTLGDWQDQVYFYLCMEDRRLWKPLFNREYPDNETFESDMLSRYMNKLKTIRDN